MKRWPYGPTLRSAATSCALLLMLISPARGGPLRINLSNGTSIEVPYYWEESGEIKFEMPGGVAGIPKASVSSIQEIVTAREFDPEVLVESGAGAAPGERQKVLRELVARNNSTAAGFEKVTPEESITLLSKMSTRNLPASSERIRGPMFANQGDFTDLVRLRGDEMMLVMQNVVTSRNQLKDRRFMLSLFDAEGNVLQRQPCDVFEVNVDNKTLKKLGILGHLFSIIATIKPDARISRYEITALQR